VGIKVTSFQRGQHAAKIDRLHWGRLTRRLAAAGFVAATAFSPLASIAAGAANAEAGLFAKGRVLLMPRPGLPEAELAKIVSVHGGKTTRITSSGLHVVELPPNASEQAVANLLAHNPHLKFAELDQKVIANLTPNDPYFGSEWHAAKIGAPTAWDSSSGAGVTIAILDSGVDGTHPDLSAQMVPGWNFYDNNSNTSDVYGHGTQTAGTAAATNNNGMGVAAIAGGAKIMPIRIADASGTGYWSMIAQGISYAADHGARVASISFDNLLSSSSILSAAQYMKSKNGLVVIAAGNCGCSPNLAPSASVIPVSATDSNDQMTGWSSYGGYVAMSAPGVSIYTTTVGGGYGQVSGTSFSSPIVAATVALMMSANPRLTNTKIESLLYSTATDLGSSGRDIYYGYGRVNAAAAMQAVLGAGTAVDSQPPTVSMTSPSASVTVSGLVSVDVAATDNVGVSKVEFRVNGATVATDTMSPYGFSWDSKSVANGMATLTAVAYDAAGNPASSAPVSVNVANATSVPPPISPVADSTPPVVQILSPASGSIKAKGSVSISASASDNSGTAGITQTLYIDGVPKATAGGASLSYGWNVNKVGSGPHTIQIVATDAVGNSSSASVQVTK
jgi:subtilisin family serine protease